MYKNIKVKFGQVLDKLQGKSSRDESEEEIMKMIVGLGNPGPKYADTRHNVGFMFLDLLAEELNIELKTAKFKGLVGEARHQGDRIVLLKPLTYMNLSGESVQAAAAWYKVAPEDILVVYDDMDIDLGQNRWRIKGSAGGHNGMKSIIQHLGSQDFPRLRIGIGRSLGESVDHVLSKFAPDERAIVADQLTAGVKGTMALIKTNDMNEVMNKFNK